MGDMKLYVWEDVLYDYTAGIVFAIAHDEEEARRVVAEEAGEPVNPDVDTYAPVMRDIRFAPPDVYDSPTGFYLFGGG